MRMWSGEEAPQKDGVALIAVRLMLSDGAFASLFESDSDIYTAQKLNSR